MAAQRYRDLQRPALIDVAARSTPSGATEAASALAESLASFSRTGFNTLAPIVDRNLAKVGAEAGAKAGVEGVPQRKSTLTTYGRAYNNAAEAGYSARLQIDIHQTIDRIEQESAGDLESYQAKVVEYEKEFLNGVPENFRPALSLILKARIADGDTRIRGQVIEDVKDKALAAYLEGGEARVQNAVIASAQLPSEAGDQALLAAVQDNDDQLDALLEDRVITKVQAVQMAAKFREDLDAGLTDYRTSGIVDSLMAKARTDVLAADRALGALDARTDLSAADKEKIRSDYRQQRELLAFERSRQFVDQSGDLAARLAGGAHGQDIDASNAELYRKGAISVDEYQSNAAAAARNAKQKQDDDVDIEAILVALNGGRGLDPTNKKQREALDKMFVQGTTTAGMTPGDSRWTATAVDVAKKTNVLPASAQSWARVNLLSGVPEQAIQGAAFISRVKEANPVAWDFNDDPRIDAYAEQLTALTAVGVDPERAFEMAQKNVYQLTDPERKLLNQQYNEAKPDNISVLQDKLDSDDEFDPFIFGGAPEASFRMKAEYDSAVAQYFKFTNGNVQLAQDMAWDGIKSRYGRSTVNGAPEIIKYAPSKMYPGITDEIIRQDITDVAKASGFTGDPKNVVMKPTPMTEDSKGLVWQLEVQDEFGVYDVLRDERNVPVIYMLPVGTAYEDARVSIAARQLQEAENQRAQLEADQARRSELEKAIAEKYVNLRKMTK